MDIWYSTRNLDALTDEDGIRLGLGVATGTVRNLELRIAVKGVLLRNEVD